MPFKNNDILPVLHTNVANASGSFDGINRKISPADSVFDEVSRLVSRHEAAHFRLNDTTAYGALLSAHVDIRMLNIINVSKPVIDEDVYIVKLDKLLRRCEAAHEIYATWEGLEIFREDYKDHSPLIRYGLQEPYLLYYSKADRLLCDIPSLNLQGLIFSAIIKWCFNSKTLFIEAQKDFYGAWISKVPIREFPTQRFEFLSRQVPRSFFKDTLQDYILTQRSSSAFDFFNAEMAGEKLEMSYEMAGVLDNSYGGGI